MGLVRRQPSRARPVGARRRARSARSCSSLPAFIAVPHHDRIVPAASAEALARLLPQATLARPAAGHVSMVVGESAPIQLWRPLTEWLRRIAPGGGQSRVRAASAIA